MKKTKLTGIDADAVGYLQAMLDQAPDAAVDLVEHAIRCVRIQAGLNDYLLSLLHMRRMPPGARLEP